MLSFPAGLLQRLQEQDPNTCVVVLIVPAGAQTWQYILRSGTDPGPSVAANGVGFSPCDYVQNVHSVSPVSSKVDVLTRKVSTSQMTVTILDDGWMRQIMGAGINIAGASLSVYLATNEDLTVRSLMWRGLVKDVVPSAGLIEIRGASAMSQLEGHNYRGSYWNEHPLQLALRLFQDYGLGASFIDTAAFDPANDVEISHFIVGTISGWGNKDPTDRAAQVGFPSASGGTNTSAITTQASEQSRSATEEVDESGGMDTLKLIGSLASMLDGSIFVDETGQATYKRFDPADPVQRVWSADDIIDLVQTSAFDNLINEVRVTQRFADGNSDELIFRDTASQNQYLSEDATSLAKPHELVMPFLSNRVAVESNITADATTNIAIVGPDVSSTSGMRVDDAFKGLATTPFPAFTGPFTQPADAVISADRPLYLKSGTEVMRATAAVPSDAFGAWGLSDLDRNKQLSGTGMYVPYRMILNGVTRGVYGTAQIWNRGQWYWQPIWDVTPIVYLANRILDRFANGVPVLEVTTSIAQADVQIGDMIEVRDIDPMWAALDGLDGSNVVKWEVTSKELDLLANPSTIKWQLSFATIETSPWTPVIVGDPIAEGAISSFHWYSYGYWYSDALQSLASATWTPLTQFGATLLAEPFGWTSPSHYTIQKTGIYSVTGSCEIASLATGEYVQCAIYVDSGAGLVPVRVGAHSYNASGGEAPATQATVEAGMLPLVQGDRVAIFGYHTDARNRNVNTGVSKTYFSIQHED